MKKNHFLPVTIISIACLFFAGCSNAPAKDEITVTPVVESPVPSVTNPNFTIAPVEYVDLSQKAFDLMSKFEFDAWGDMLADNVMYSFPDGDVDTRTKLEGKAAVVGWWKNWKENSGIESMTMSEFNNTPIDVTVQPKGGASKGIYVISYFSNTMVFKGKPVALRMNFSMHFNADKKIDRYATYYDRAVIIKATGRNLLEEIKPAK